MSNFVSHTINIVFFFLGQQRSRMLATLFKDERCQQLAAYGILEKMYLDRIIRGNQLQEFAAMLMPHQKATTADGERSKLALRWGKMFLFPPSLLQLVIANIFAG